MIQHAIEKASVLIDAMPYIQEFRGDIVVVKFGGSILENEAEYLNILRDIAFMEIIGMRPVVVHGGGKAISKNMQKAGIEPNFLNGLRVTDAETIAIVEKTLNHEVNVRVCEALKSFQAHSEGLHGQNLFQVVKHTEKDSKTGAELDWGFVGDVVSVDTAPILEAVKANKVPVVTPLGSDADGKIYNINADVAAGAMARELHARKLVFLSDVPGILKDPEDPSSLISSVTMKEVEQLIADGVIAGGMLPKVSGAIQALKAGIRKTHFIDASLPHSLLLELFTREGVGTEILASEENS